jgi:lambda repressor-like predicted transcriptional regulator
VAEWHLAELEAELRRAGWVVSSVAEGDGYEISAVWEVARGDTTLRIEFEGMDALGAGVALPLERAYACRVEGTSVSLYFGKKSGRAWRPDLEQFVSGLAFLRTDWRRVELEAELSRAGWGIVSASEGDGRRTAAVWEVTHWDAAHGPRAHRIVFDQLDESAVALSPDRGHGCHVDGTGIGLSFGETAGREWRNDLERFVRAVSSIR